MLEVSIRPAHPGTPTRLFLVSMVWLGVSCLLLAAAAPPVHAALSSTPNPFAWSADGPVHALALSPDQSTLYLGGNFTYVGPRCGGAVAVDPGTGLAVGRNPAVDGSVNAAAPDGSGGWYIAGDFTHVGGVARNRLARILADGIVDPTWKPVTDGVVHDLAVASGRVYIGGAFATVNTATTRMNIAALDAATGALIADWDPGADHSVTRIVPAGGLVYVAGPFSTIGKATRSGLAALDPATGEATAWAPAAGFAAAPADLAVDSTTAWFVRSGVHAFDLASAAERAWTTENTLSVSKIALSGTTLYAFAAAGTTTIRAFDTANGQLRPGFAITFDALSNPIPMVSSLLVRKGKLYAAGRFKFVQGVARTDFAAFHADTGALDPDWQVHSRFLNTSDTPMLAIHAAENSLYLTGNFDSAGGRNRTCLAAIHVQSGTATDWDPRIESDLISPIIYALHVHEGRLYFGGSFDRVAGQLRHAIAAADAATGALSPWNPQGVGSAVRAILAAHGRIYAAGTFSAPQPSLVALDPTTAAIIPWNPGFNPTEGIYSLLDDGPSLIVGGRFSTVGASTREYLAKVDTDTTAVLEWNPGVAYTLQPLGNPAVRALAKSGRTLFLGGTFTNVDTQAVPNLAAVDLDTGRIKPWVPIRTDNTTVWSLAVDGPTLYVGTSASAMAFQVSSAAQSNWIPALTSFPANAFAPTPGRIFVGLGIARTASYSSLTDLLEFNDPTLLPTPTPTVTPTSTPTPTFTASPSPTETGYGLAAAAATLQHVLGREGELPPVDANDDAAHDCSDVLLLLNAQ